MLPIFPEHALDLSLYTSILVGLLSTWLLFELFGWVFAGFVVAGYLAALGHVAPGGLVMVLVESVLCFGIVWGLAAGLSKLGVWSRVFGRERFLLFLLVAIPIRLVVTGMAAPRVSNALLHLGLAPEDLGVGLYGVGVVLVPLTANTFWKLGISRGLVQVGATGAITWAAMGLLLTFTNLGFGGFAQTFDAMAVHPFESSRVWLVLIATVFVAARNNLRYGWDFGGILVPALMAVLIFRPVRYATTVAEIIILYGLYTQLIRLPWVRELDLSGPRRIVSVYAVAWVYKVALAWALAGAALQVPISDLYGFGFLLTSLVVTRCHKQGSILSTLAPLVGTSLQGIAVAVPFALAMSWATASGTADEVETLQTLPMQAQPALLSLSSHVDATPRAVVPPDPEARATARVLGPVGTCELFAPAPEETGPRAPFVLDCGGEGPVLVVDRPLADPDALWLASWLLGEGADVSGVVVASVDPSQHPTRGAQAGWVQRGTLEAAQSWAGARPVLLVATGERREPVLHPRGRQPLAPLQEALALGTLRFDPGEPDADLRDVWTRLRPQDAVLSMHPDAVPDRTPVDHVAWTDVLDLPPGAPPTDRELLLDVLLPAVRRALDGRQRPHVPPHLVWLAGRCGARWATATDPSGTRHWVLVRRDDASEAVDRWVFRPDGTDWTVLVSDGHDAPGLLRVGLHQHTVLGARAAWLGARPPHGDGHHPDVLRGAPSILDRMARTLLAPLAPGEAPSRTLLVEIAPTDPGGVRLSRGGAVAGDPLLVAMPELSRAMAPWPGHAEVDEASPEASWVPSLGGALHYTRAMRPDGLAIAWFPSTIVQEVQGTPDHGARVAWYRDAGVPVLEGSLPAPGDAPLQAPDVLATLARHADLPTDGSLLALDHLDGWSLHVLDDGLRLVPVVEGPDGWCARVAGAADASGTAGAGCWRTL